MRLGLLEPFSKAFHFFALKITEISLIHMSVLMTLHLRESQNGVLTL